MRGSAKTLAIRFGCGIAASLLFGCASTPEQQAARQVCDLRSNCFYERNVRSFEMVDQNTMVVEVGSARCPFLVEVDGFMCNLGISSAISFMDSDGRICSFDNAYVAGIFANDPNDVCRIRQVRAINDDELLERYAIAGRLPPLPPSGSGELEVEDASDPDAQADDAAESSAATGELEDESG